MGVSLVPRVTATWREAQNWGEVLGEDPDPTKPRERQQAGAGAGHTWAAVGRPTAVAWRMQQGQESGEAQRREGQVRLEPSHFLGFLFPILHLAKNPTAW